MKILVTGAGGYLGAVLVPRLLQAGHTVLAADTFPNGNPLRPHQSLHVHVGDIRSATTDLVAGADTVVALAAVSNDPAAALSPTWTVEVNETATERLTRIAQEAGARRLIHASSCGVYGHSDGVITEADPVLPLSEYSWSKLRAEQALVELETPEFRVISLRLGTLFGVSPQMRTDLGVHMMTLSAMADRRVRVDGDGQQWRPFLHVADAAAAIVRCLDIADEHLPAHSIFNVVGQNLRVAELAQQVVAQVEGAEIEFAAAKSDRRSYQVSGRRFAQVCGFAPSRTVADGIAEVAQWLAQPHRVEEARSARYSAAATLARRLREPAIDGGQPIRDQPLPFALPSLGEAEKAEVLDTLNSNWLTTGPKVQRFEQMCADYLGVSHAIAVSSCTAALHLTLAASGVGSGDEVITSPITWPATGNVIVQTGATPVFADIDPDTLNIDPAAVRAAITDRTRAIMPVHMAGQPCDMDAIGGIAEAHNLFVAEDAAHALGAEYAGIRIGKTSKLAAYSFYATKNITTIEGGLIATDDDELADQIRILASHGISRDAWRRNAIDGSIHWHLFEAGFKYNMTDVSAAIGLHQLPRLDEFIATRTRYADLYDQLLRDVPGVRIPVRVPGMRHTHHLYVIQLELDQFTVTRDRFIEALRAENIGTGVHFISLHLQPYYRRVHGYAEEAFPVARAVSERIVSLPLYPGMTETDVQDAAAAVTKLATAYHH